MKKIKFSLFISLAVAAVILCFSSSAFAEGSKELTKNGGNRPYLEWYDGKTLEIQRHNTMNVFARAGEKICLGSSIYKSSDSKDIVVTTPSGEKVVLDVLDTGLGFISSPNMEQVGPYPEKGGYTPFVYEVTQTGIYKIEFHSSKSAINSDNPVPILTNESFFGKQFTSVAAFDATVIGKDGNEIPGRGYFNYLCLNSGRNEYIKQGVYSDLYILTNDGYDYKVSLNGINPFGFIIVANNRGFIDPVSNTSLYKTIGSKDNEMNQESIFGNIKILMPTGENTKTNITHKIFLNVPANDLPESIPTVAQLPSDVKSVSFTGIEDGVAGVGNGGLFKIELTKDATYTIYLDVDNDGLYDGENDVQLSNAGVKGSNTIYWNGKDASGNNVNAGTVGVKAMAKGGEYHFPLLDVELLTKGIKVELLNAPRDYDGFDPFAVYYDDGNYTTADGTKVVIRDRCFSNGNAQYTLKHDSKFMINPESALSGISSADGVLAFGDPNKISDESNFYGDRKGFDFWTYYQGETIESEILVEEAEKKTSIIGNIFYDKDEDSSYGLDESGIESVKVNIFDLAGNLLAQTTTDAAGNYSAVVSSTADKKYIVSVDKTPTGYKTTTSEKSIIVVEKLPGIIYVPDIGYTYTIDVTVDVSVDEPEVKQNDLITFTIEAINDTNFTANSVVVDAPLPAYAIFKEIVNASAFNFDAETGSWNVGTLKPHQTIKMQIKAVATELGEYSYPVTISAEGDLYKDDVFENNFAETAYEVIENLQPVLSNDFAYIFGRSDTRMEADDNIFRGEVAAVIYRLMKQNDPDGTPDGFVYDISATPNFSDIKGRWDRSAIEYMTYKGMYEAAPSSKIKPLEPITRGEAFKAICIGFGFTTDTDLNIDEYANMLIDEGYVDGFDDGTLRLDENVTRAQFCKVYNGIIGRDDLPLVTADGTSITAETYHFKDLDPHEWYYGIMLKATSAYVNGYVDIEARGIRNQLDDYTK